MMWLCSGTAHLYFDSTALPVVLRSCIVQQHIIFLQEPDHVV